MATELQRKIADYLVGSCQNESGVVDAFWEEAPDLTEEDVLAAIIATEIDPCTFCGWWFEGFELEVVDDELVCDDCIRERDA